MILRCVLWFAPDWRPSIFAEASQGKSTHQEWLSISAHLLLSWWCSRMRQWVWWRREWWKPVRYFSDSLSKWPAGQQFLASIWSSFGPEPRIPPEIVLISTPVIHYWLVIVLLRTLSYFYNFLEQLFFNIKSVKHNKKMISVLYHGIVVIVIVLIFNMTDSYQ